MEEYARRYNGRMLTSNDLQEKSENERHSFAIQDVVELWIESDFYAQDSKEIQIANFTLTRITENAMDIQLDFKYPSKITQSVNEPDKLYVHFK